MNRSHIIFISFCLSISYSSIFAQIGGGAEYIQRYANLMTKKAKGPDLVGSIYLNEKPHKVEIKLKDGIVILDDARLNLQNSSIDVFHNGEEKEILMQDFEYVLINENGVSIKYIPAPHFKFEGKSLTGFVKFYGDGNTKIFVNAYNYLRKANSDSKIIGGEMDDRLIRKDETYVLKGVVAHKLDNKKDLYAIYKENRNIVDKVLKEKSINLKRPDSVLLVVDAIEASI